MFLFGRFIKLTWASIAFLALLYAVGCGGAPNPVRKIVITDAVIITAEPLPFSVPGDPCDFSSVYGSIESCLGIEMVLTPSPTEKPSQARALEIVWRKVYGRDVPPPTIIWIEKDHLKCGTGPASDGKKIGGKEAIAYRKRHPNEGPFWNGWIDVNLNDTGQIGCVYGAFDPISYTMRIAWPVGTKRISSTSFSHELAHAWRWKDNGEVNYGHRGIDFAPRGTVWRADRALRKVGL